MIDLNRYTEEGIKYQAERKIVVELEEHFRVIRNYIRDEYITSGDTVYKHSGIRKEFASISNIIYKRFNLKIKHVYGHSLYAILPIRLNQNNAISPDGKELFKVLRTALNSCNDECVSTMEPDRIRTIESKNEALSVIRQTLDNAKTLEKDFVDGKIEIDYKNAKIKGFKQKNPIYALCDPVIAFLILKLTTKEMVAALLHEIGHAFTYIEAVYTSNRRVISTTEYALDELNKVDNLKIDGAYMKELLKRELDEGDKHNRVMYSNSEQVADLFSARFGMAVPLATLLEKASGKHVSFIRGIGITLRGLVSLPLVIAFILFGAAVVSFILISLALVLILSTIFKILIGSNKGRATTYDNDKDRIRLLKLELIAQLRLGSIPKSEIMHHIESIDRLEEIEKVLKDETLTEKVSRKLGFNASNISFYEFDKRSADLINNTVHKHLAELEINHKG